MAEHEEGKRKAIEDILQKVSLVIAHSVSHPNIAGTIANWKPEELGDKLHAALQDKIRRAMVENAQ